MYIGKHYLYVLDVVSAITSYMYTRCTAVEGGAKLLYLSGKLALPHSRELGTAVLISW